MNKGPLISVVMPARNVEKFIGEAIESILVQTLSDFELIIINDGSTDKTLCRGHACGITSRHVFYAGHR